jgi:hypothetical protein
MTGGRPGFEAELRRLRKGEALYAPDLLGRLGPTMRQLAGIAGADDAPTARRKVAAWLTTAAAVLTADERGAVAAAFALPPASRERFLNDRLRLLAQELHCDERTARRRVDEAIRRLAAVHEPAPAAEPADAWYVASFTAVLRLDVEPPEAFEERSVVALVDGLTELTTSVSVPRHPEDRSEAHRVEAELVYGGQLGARAQPYETYFEHVIFLAEPLNVGDRHSYAMRLRPPPGQPMAPHYVHVPLRRSDSFDLRIRFDPARLPRRMWRFNGVPPSVITQATPTADLLEPDRFGDVRCVFRHLRQGLGYGVRWET